MALVWTSKVYSAKSELKLPDSLELAIDDALANNTNSPATNLAKKIAEANRKKEEDVNYWICLICSKKNEFTAKYCGRCLDNENYKLDKKHPLEFDHRKSPSIPL